MVFVRNSLQFNYVACLFYFLYIERLVQFTQLTEGKYKLQMRNLTSNKLRCYVNRINQQIKQLIKTYLKSSL